MSKGSDAASGSEAVDRAVIFVKPAMDKGVTAASLPPAIAASQYPCLIARKASPTALQPVAQAVTTQMQEPLALNRIAICPAARFDIIMGTKNGETFLGPPPRSLECSSISVTMPPMPEPKETANLSGATVPRIPLSFTA